MSFTEQHMQPFASGTKGAGWADVEFASETVSCFSMSIAILMLVKSLSDEEGIRTITKLVENNSNSLSMFLGQNVVE